MSSINAPLLRKVLEYITEHPEEWVQDEWAVRGSCGTAYCVGGHTAVMSGAQLDWVSVLLDNGESGWGATRTTDHRDIDHVAADALGLTYVQADEMFDACNSLPYLWNLAHTFTKGEIQPPPEIAKVLDRDRAE